MAIIKIKRDSGYADRIRVYHVMLDGQMVGKISNGESIEIAIEPGNHELFLKIDWCRSNKIDFVISADEIRAFDCGSSLIGIKVLLAIVYVTFLWNEYIWLRDTNSLQPTDPPPAEF